ncbi:MacB family efflux pump subunit [Hyphomicrobiaceae bacterium 22]|uniref:Pyoverdine export ATP-binding/permease protein PvdT n=2 Tax=Prosthecodimorpha staleyi TaxID=2840188 RepID=A0A947D481_9HYPH|nr:MacB family efflux pump subunit [Prosthecodimorpha staleyi]
MISLHGVGREYPAGEGTVAVLADIDLDVRAGEFVAIMGASGSGKSTLMNILGCLDRPSSGAYRFKGRSTAELDPDELAELRREHFGFIFQRYHLLSELSAVGNTEIPAIYAGTPGAVRQERAAALLTRLGLADRIAHRPGQLSGGQQQRVSIARALMNGADVVLADEPTGALDRRSGEEVLKILAELNAEGHTVILVTHDAQVARRARRIVVISDGRIVSDEPNPAESGEDGPAGASLGTGPGPTPPSVGRLRAFVARFEESFHMAILAMLAHRMRTFLTMLGIVIGISSVVAMVALGEGSRQKVLSNISSLGTNTLEIFPGKDFGDVRSARIKTLVLADAEALARETWVAGVTPTVSTSSTLRYGAIEASAQVNGVGPDYFEVKATKLKTGRFFDAGAARAMSQEIVIDENSAKTLFPDPSESPIGKVILVGKVPCTIIGVTQKQQGFGASGNLSVFLAYTTVQVRFLGDTSLRSILLRVADTVDTTLAEQAATAFLIRRHGTKDFFVLNTDDIRQTITATTTTLALLIAAIAVISLVVGGIGVMNIMLVSVSERVKEIGVRMAVGARRSDILRQFLTEAVLVCLIGGVLGVAVALAAGFVFALLGSTFVFVYSATTILAAFGCSTLIGVVFGWLPAHGAARLDPVAALARD